jgi:hypothetical protein
LRVHGRDTDPDADRDHAGDDRGHADPDANLDHADADADRDDAHADADTDAPHAAAAPAGARSHPRRQHLPGDRLRIAPR